MSTDGVLPTGTRLAHYEVRREIGSGAMGTVYEAWDTALDRPVAVKVLRQHIAHEPGVMDRFFREARAAARVNHPNLTHIYFVGREDGRPFFAMEYVPGSTLEQLVAQRGPLPVAEAVELLVHAARGLAAAHSAGVVHRDVKPSNLIRRDDGALKVADFGLAKSTDGDLGATGGASLMGTPTYMSPEQCRGREIGARTDVYALGLVAWFVLVGRPPYDAKSLGELLNDQMNTPLPSATAVRPELPAATDDVLAKLCAKDPAQRPVSMQEVEALFESLRPRRITLAPFFGRAAAHFVDATVVTLAVSTVFAALAGITALLEGSPLPVTPPSELWAIVKGFLAMAGGAVVAMLPEVLWQTSLGKYLFDLGVVRADGTRPGLVAMFVRLALRFPFLIVYPVLSVLPNDGVAVLAALLAQVVAVVAGTVCWFARDGRTLSDVVTGTCVAYRRPVA